MNAWVLAKHLSDVEADAELPEVVRSMAARMREAYQYPVDSQVYSPAGELLGQLAANDMPPRADRAYLELLDSALPTEDEGR